MGEVLTDRQEAFLQEQLFAVLATGRRDGSPQVSLVGFHWNGADVVVSIRQQTAKWRNALRQPKVALLFHHEYKQLVIYGTAECIGEDPLRAELSARIRNHFAKNPNSTHAGQTYKVDADLIADLDREGRGILRITPNNVLDVMIDD